MLWCHGPLHPSVKQSCARMLETTTVDCRAVYALMTVASPSKCSFARPWPAKLHGCARLFQCVPSPLSGASCEQPLFMFRSAPAVCDCTANYRPGVNTTHSLFFVLNTRTQKRRAFSFWWPKSTHTKKCLLRLPLFSAPSSHPSLSHSSLLGVIVWLSWQKDWETCEDRHSPLPIQRPHADKREAHTGMKPHVLFISKGGRRHTNRILTPAISKQKTPLNGHEGEKKMKDAHYEENRDTQRNSHTCICT